MMTKKTSIAIAVVTALFISNFVAAQGNLTQPTSTSAGAGLTKSGSTLNVGAGTGITVNTDDVAIDPTYTQRRVSTTCLAGSSIRAIAQDGTVTCETDDAGVTNSAGNNVITKSDGTNLVPSLWSDDGTTTTYNINKFTIAAPTGNTAIAGTLGVTGLATLTGGFSSGAQSDMTSHKIVNLTNGSASSDAAAFGQIATAVNAAVSGTPNTFPIFNGTNSIGNSTLVYDGSSTISTTSKLGVIGTGAGLPTSLDSSLPGTAYVVHGASNYGLVVARATASTGAANLVLYHTRATDAATKTALVSGDLIGTIGWQGATDSATVSIGAQISAAVSGTVSTGVIPTELQFRTTTTNNPTTRLRIDATGTTNMLAQGVGVGGIYASGLFGAPFGAAANFGDMFYAGVLRKNLSLYSNPVGDNVASDGHWRVSDATSTTSYTTSSQSAPWGYTDTVGQITCTDGGGLCSNSGTSDYRYVATSATTFITDLRNKTITASLYVKTASGTNTGFGIAIARYNDNNSSSYSSCTVNSTTWTRCSQTFTFDNTNLADNSELRVYIHPLSTTAHYIAAAQIELGSEPTPVEVTGSTIGGHSGAYNPFPLSGYSGGVNGDTATGVWTSSLGIGGNGVGDPAALIGPAGDISARSLAISTTGGGGSSFYGVKINSTVQVSERIRFTGQEFYQASNTSTDGPTFLLGVNRSTNRQVWLAESNALTQNSTNRVLRFAVGGTLGDADISAIATDGVTTKTLNIQQAGGPTIIGGKTTVALAATAAFASSAGTALEITQAAGSNEYISFRQTDAQKGLHFDNNWNTGDGAVVYDGGRGMQIATAGTVRIYADSNGVVHTGTTSNTGVTGAVAQEIGGQVQATGTDPTLSTCGTSPTIVGSDLAGIVTIGSGTATACTLTFASTYTAEPACVITPASTTGTAWSFSAKSATAFTVTSSGGSNLAGLKFNYVCFKM